MKISFMKAFTTITFCAITTISTLAQNTTAYITGSTEPWNGQATINALNEQIGQGKWDKVLYQNASDIFNLDKYDFIFIEGGDHAASTFNQFVENHRLEMEKWVTNGGSLLLNAARNGGRGRPRATREPVLSILPIGPTDDLYLGFGATLKYNTNNTATAIDPTHTIFNSPYNTGNNIFNGSGISHDYIEGNDLTFLLTNDEGNSPLAERSYGQGHVIFGGLTLPYTSWNQEQNKALHRNLINYAATIPEPAAIITLTLGLITLLPSRKNKQNN